MVAIIISSKRAKYNGLQLLVIVEASMQLQRSSADPSLTHGHDVFCARTG